MLKNKERQGAEQLHIFFLDRKAENRYHPEIIKPFFGKS